MSYILDALKRSEQERERAEVPMQTAVALGSAPAEPRRGWSAPVAALIVAVNLAVLGWLGWQRLGEEQSAAPTAAAPVVTARSNSSLAHLAGSDRNAPILSAPASAAAEAAPANAPVALQPIPQTAPAVTVAAAPLQPTPAPSAAEAPLLAQLPEGVRRSVPPLNVGVHVFSEQAANRFVLVDMKRFGEGSELPNGLRIERITPRGLVLNHQGQRFQLVVR